MTDSPKTVTAAKLRAFLTHLTLSFVVVGSVCALIFFVWYPSPYFEAKGAWNVLRVLLGVDLMVGPILTLILYRPNKWGLKFDMTVIVMLQLGALIYGTTTIFMERPYFVVFAVDRFEVIAKREVDVAAIEDPRLLEKPLVGPIPVVAVRPDDIAGMQRLIDEVMFQGKPDIERRPEYWKPYGEAKHRVLERIQPLRKLLAHSPETRARIERIAEAHGRSLHSLGYLPLVGQDRDFAFLVDATDATLIDLVDADPWLE